MLRESQDQGRDPAGTALHPPSHILGEKAVKWGDVLDGVFSCFRNFPNLFVSSPGPTAPCEHFAKERLAEKVLVLKRATRTNGGFRGLGTTWAALQATPSF